MLVSCSVVDGLIAFYPWAVLHQLGVNCSCTLHVHLKIAPGGWRGEWLCTQQESEEFPGLRILEIKRLKLAKFKQLLIVLVPGLNSPLREVK